MNRSTRRRHRALSSLAPLLLLLVGCASYPQRDPTLAELDRAVAADETERVGGWLMDRPAGLNRLDTAETVAPLVAVHGYASEGREWVAPLATLGAPGTTWYRWDWRTCPEAGVERLAAAIDAVASRPGTERIRIVGHSYGGLISALMAHRYAGPVPLDVHVVAAPLAGIGRMTALCGEVEPGAAGSGAARITQWRTVQAQDGAFEGLEVDPQVVDWAGSQVVQLPARWAGGRLGHNRSLQWVAEALVAGAAQAGAGDASAEPSAEPATDQR